MTEEMEKNFKDLEELYKLGMLDAEGYAFQKKQLEDEMARESGQAASAPIQQETTSPSLEAPPPLPEIPKIHVSVGGREIGEFEHEEVIKKIRTGEIRRDARVWKKGMPDWVDAGNLPELEDYFGPPPDKTVTMSPPADPMYSKWRLVRTFEGHKYAVNSVAFSPDGRHIVSGSYDKTLKLWETASGRLVRTFEDHERVISVAFSPDGQYIVSGFTSSDKTLKLWETASGRLVRTFEDAASVKATFNPDGQYIVSGSDTLKLWETASGRLVRTFEGHNQSVSSVAFSPDGRHIVSGTSYEGLKLWETASGRLVRTFEDAAYVIATFNPDGQYIVSGSSDKTLKLWETGSGRLIRTFEGHKYNVISVAFSPDGRHIVSGSVDKTLKLWETSSGRLVRTFEGHEREVNSVAFSPDGRHIVSGSVDTTLKLWGVE